MNILTARILQCRFPGSNQTYAYFTDNPDIQKDDLVLVGTPRGTVSETFAVPYEGKGLEDRYIKVVQVVSTEETVEGIEKVREWIICKLDFSSYNDRRASEKKREVLIAKIRRAKEEAIQTMDLQSLANMSPELGVLVAQLTELNNPGKPQVTKD